MKEQMPNRQDITHTMLSVLFISLLVGLSFWILRPFLVSIIWGIVIVIATWPVLDALQKWPGMGRGLAVTLMTVALLLVFLVPLMFAIVTIARNSQNISTSLKSFETFSIPKPPEWLNDFPIAGKKITERWTAFSKLGPEQRSAAVAPYAQRAMRRFVAAAGSTGVTLINFLLTVVFSTVLFAKGEIFREGLLRFSRRLAGRRGEEVVVLAAKAVRGVVLGVLLTAITQAIVGSIGLLITGVPAAALLTAVMFILCLAQLGPLLVLIPAIVWLYASGQAGMGTVLIVFSVVAGTIDNVLRPFLIRRGANLPLLLIIVGVIGGIIAFGVIGLFVGPVILAVTYTLAKAWVSEEVPVEETSLVRVKQGA